MDTHETNSAPLPAGGSETNISHFIPSTELSGTRAEKLKKLDTLIDYLMRLRRSLAGEVLLGRGGYEGPGPHISSPAWPWFVGGLFLGAVFVLLLITARACSL